MRGLGGTFFWIPLIVLLVLSLPASSVAVSPLPPDSAWLRGGSSATPNNNNKEKEAMEQSNRLLSRQYLPLFRNTGRTRTRGRGRKSARVKHVRGNYRSGGDNAGDNRSPYQPGDYYNTLLNDNPFLQTNDVPQNNLPYRQNNPRPYYGNGVKGIGTATKYRPIYDRPAQPQQVYIQQKTGPNTGTVVVSYQHHHKRQKYHHKSKGSKGGKGGKGGGKGGVVERRPRRSCRSRKRSNGRRKGYRNNNENNQYTTYYYDGDRRRKQKKRKRKGFQMEGMDDDDDDFVVHRDTGFGYAFRNPRQKAATKYVYNGQDDSSGFKGTTGFAARDSSRDHPLPGYSSLERYYYDGRGGGGGGKGGKKHEGKSEKGKKGKSAKYRHHVPYYDAGDDYYYGDEKVYYFGDGYDFYYDECDEIGVLLPVESDSEDVPAPTVPTAQPTMVSAVTPRPTVPPGVPTATPSDVPTNAPSESPTLSPTATPTKAPTRNPTTSPTMSPTKSPTMTPTQSPTTSPTMTPTTAEPTENPTPTPTETPTSSPTMMPTTATDSPTMSPTMTPTTAEPTENPTMMPTLEPSTVVPTMAPTNATDPPTMAPTNATDPPTMSPTIATDPPTISPTMAPTMDTAPPTAMPTPGTDMPSIMPSGNTASPTGALEVVVDFGLMYTLNPNNLPSESNLNTIQALTQRYLEEILLLEYDFNLATTLDSFMLALVMNTDQNGVVTIDWESTVNFGMDSTMVPSAAEVEALIQGAFTDAGNNAIYLDLLQNTGASNAFSETTKVEYVPGPSGRSSPLSSSSTTTTSEDMLEKYRISGVQIVGVVGAGVIVLIGAAVMYYDSRGRRAARLRRKVALTI